MSFDFNSFGTTKDKANVGSNTLNTTAVSNTTNQGGSFNFASFGSNKLPSNFPQEPQTDTSKIGTIPLIDTLTNIGVGIGTEVGKAGLGVGQSFLKLGNVVGNVLGTGKNQYDANIKAIETIKNQLYTQPFEQQLSTIGGKTGEFIGAAIPFAASEGATLAGQQFTRGLASGTIKSLAEQTGLKKVAGYFIKTAADVLPETVNAYATQYIASGGDKQSAKDVGLAVGVLSSLTHVGSDIYKTIIPTTVKAALGRTFRYGGKTKLGNIVNDKQLNDSVEALTTINNLAPEIKVLDTNGIEKVFNPKEATLLEMPQALYQTKNKIYDAYSTLAEQAGDKGAYLGQSDFNKIVNELNKYSEAGYTKAYSNKAQDIIESIYRYGKVNPVDGGIYFPNVKPSEIQKIIESINKDVNPASDGAGAIVAQDASQIIRNVLDSKIEQATGGTYQQLRNAYSQLKTLEQPIINAYKKALRDSGGTFSQSIIDGISSVDAIMGIITHNPVQVAKAGVIKVVAKLLKYNKDPETNLRRAFELLRETAGESIPSGLGARLFTTQENTPAFKVGQKSAEAIKSTLDTSNIPNKQGGFIKTGVSQSDNVSTDLLQEAKKYKSAEEFVKAQGESFYHTTPNKFDKFDKKYLGTNTEFDNTRSGFFFTDNLDQIQEFKDKLQKGFGGNFIDDGLKKTPEEIANYRIIEKIAKKENFFNFNYKAKDLTQKEARDFAEFADKKMGGLYDLDGNRVNYKKMSDSELHKFLKDNVFIEDLDPDSSFLPQFTEQYLEDFNKFLEKKGYKGMISDYGAGKNEYLIFDPNILPTKSQLTDIWNKANKK